VVGGHNEICNIELVRTILKTVAELTGQEAREDLIEMVIDRPGHDRRYAIDASRIDRELGWKPTYRFEEGLRQTVAWYLENQEWVRKSLSRENRRQEQF
jgi:dTDP-glucose 4,6-dehydratase